MLTPSPSPSEPPEIQRQRLWATLLLALNTVVAVALFAGSWLRETPLFWRNAGGYPLLLRDLVRSAWPMVLGADLVFVGALSLVLLQGLRRPSGRGWLGPVLLALQWLLLAAALAVSLLDNLINVMEGRPWFDHH